MTSEYKHIWSTSSKKRTYKLFIPKNKNKKLDAYVKENDTITKAILESFGISMFPRVLRGCAKRLNVSITPINNSTWEIKR